MTDYGHGKFANFIRANAFLDFLYGTPGIPRSGVSRAARIAQTAPTMAVYPVVSGTDPKGNPWKWLAPPPNLPADWASLPQYQHWLSWHYIDADIWNEAHNVSVPYDPALNRINPAIWDEGIPQPQGELQFVPISQIDADGYAIVLNPGDPGYVQVYVSKWGGIFQRLELFRGDMDAGDDGVRAFVALTLAVHACLKYDLTGKAAYALALYAPWESLKPFASLPSTP